MYTDLNSVDKMQNIYENICMQVYELRNPMQKSEIILYLYFNETNKNSNTHYI